MKATKSQILRSKLKEILPFIEGRKIAEFKIKMLIQNTYAEEQKLGRRKNMRQSKQKMCNQPLIVERYGGGLRYHCPVCDVGSNSNSVKVAYWTNGTPPESNLCEKKR